MDNAIEQAVTHVGPNGIMETSGSVGFQFRSSSVNAQGQVVQKIGRFDVNPNPLNSHVSPNGVYSPHLNLETQINGVPIRSGPLADPHTPIISSTIRPGDFP